MKFIYILFIFFLTLAFVNPVYAAYIPVPFTVQAPEADWGQPWQDACEEAVIAMTDRFYANQGEFGSIRTAKEAILDIIKIKEKNIGASRDENAQTITAIINNFLSWEA